ncbi:MAG: hypothetical protein JXA30_19375 [Deltaproteobacteria bacterium]|nr:hypothetical protein [Deltaproteobacteria bacterium]
MTPTRITIEEIKKMNQAELDKLYGESKAGPIPNGDSKGTILVFPTSPAYEATMRQVESGQQWEGKVFYCPNPEGPGTLKNKVAGKLIFEAQVYYGNSDYDGGKCIVLDYSGAPEFQHLRFRDEIRRVAEGLYLGRMYRVDSQGKSGDFLLNFACDFT